MTATSLRIESVTSRRLGERSEVFSTKLIRHIATSNPELYLEWLVEFVQTQLENVDNPTANLIVKFKNLKHAH